MNILNKNIFTTLFAIFIVVSIFNESEAEDAPPLDKITSDITEAGSKTVTITDSLVITNLNATEETTNTVVTTTVTADTLATNDLQLTASTDTIRSNNSQSKTTFDTHLEPNPKITLLLKGGVGSQMFQYAAAYSIAKNNNYEICIDVTSYVKNKYNKKCGYILADILPNIKTKKLPFHAKLKKTAKPISNFSDFFKKRSRKSKYLYSIKEELAYDGKINNIKPNTYIEGCFFNYNYFVAYNDEIIKMFSELPLSINAFTIYRKITNEASNTVAIHYRDYRDKKAGGINDEKYYDNLSVDYYINAVNLLKEKVSDAKFYVFSNNIENAKKVLSSIITSLEFIEYVPDDIWEDMKLMSLCNHNIIANSSYSYWAAYINTNKDKIVVAPEKFFSWQKDDDSDFCPDEWIRIEAPFQKKP